jgi:hypothetical protein
VSKRSRPWFRQPAGEAEARGRRLVRVRVTEKLVAPDPGEPPYADVSAFRRGDLKA